MRLDSGALSDDAPEIEVQDEVAPEDEHSTRSSGRAGRAALAHVRKWGDPC
jgi:hypothetical protein